MVKTWSEEGEERGRDKGKVEGKRELLLKLLKCKFPDLSETVRQRLTEWPVEKLEEVGLALLTAPSLGDLGLED